jgi:hypothetical protein
MVASAQKHMEVVVWLSKHGANAQAVHQQRGITAADVSRHYDAPAELTEYLEARTHCANPGCDGAGLKKASRYSSVAPRAFSGALAGAQGRVQADRGSGGKQGEVMLLCLFYDS